MAHSGRALRHNASGVSLADLWSQLEGVHKSEEEVYTSLKAILSAASRLENQRAVFTMKRLKLLQRIISSEHSLLVLCAVCTLIHLACSCVDLHEVIINSGLVPPLCDALTQWTKADLNTSASGQIRLQILEVVLFTVLQLTSGSVRTHDILHAEKIVPKLCRLLSPKTSPLFKESKDKRDLPKLLIGKSLYAKSIKLNRERVKVICDQFYTSVCPDIDNERLRRPSEGYVVDLYKARDDKHSRVAWELAAAGNVWLSEDPMLPCSEWIRICPTAFITNTLFWAQIGENGPEQQEKVSTHLREWKQKMFLKCAPTTGAYVGYHCQITNMSHRCQVIEADCFGQEYAKVLCLDTGRVMRVPHQNLFLLLPDMKLKQFPVLATVCKLHGVRSPPISTKLIELAVTSLYNLATITDRLELFVAVQEPVVMLCHCGQLSVMWRSLRTLSNMAHSAEIQTALLDTQILSFVLGLCEKYPDMASQTEQDVRLVLQAGLRLLGSLMWECDDAKTAFIEQKGIDILTGLIKSSTADVTAEAFHTLKSYLGRTVITPLSISDIRTLKPRTSEESDALSAVITEMQSAAAPHREKDLLANCITPRPSGSPRRPQGGSYGASSQFSPSRTTVSADEPTAAAAGGYDGDIVDTADLEENTAPVMVRHESCGFEEDERHAFLQIEKNRIHNLGIKPMQQLACGFLNADEGGSIYLGINPAGAVLGIEISRFERDELRMGLDRTLSKIQNNVLAENYNMKFCPVQKVYWMQGERVEENIADLFVVEICLKPNYSEHLYYMLPDEVYYREGNKTVHASAMDIQRRNVLKKEADYLMEMKGLEMEIRRLKEQQ